MPAETEGDSRGGFATTSKTLYPGAGGDVVAVNKPSSHGAALVRNAQRGEDVVAFEIAMVSFFVDAADLLGVPKSVAAIYGLCFASVEPLSFADLSDRLEISSGSISQPVKIVDLARQMIELSGLRVDDDIEIKFIGLKPGEKLYEERQHHSEDYASTTHPHIMRLISQVSVEQVSCAAIAEEKGLPGLENNELKKLLKRIVPEYAPFLD